MSSPPCCLVSSFIPSAKIIEGHTVATPCVGTPAPGASPPTLPLLHWALSWIIHPPPQSGLLFSSSPESKWSKIWVVPMVLGYGAFLPPDATLAATPTSNQLYLIAIYFNVSGLSALPNFTPTWNLWSMLTKSPSLSLPFVVSSYTFPAGVHPLNLCLHPSSPELIAERQSLRGPPQSHQQNGHYISRVPAANRWYVLIRTIDLIDNLIEGLQRCGKGVGNHRDLCNTQG